MHTACIRDCIKHKEHRRRHRCGDSTLTLGRCALSTCCHYPHFRYIISDFFILLFHKYFFIFHLIYISLYFYQISLSSSHMTNRPLRIFSPVVMIIVYNLLFVFIFLAHTMLWCNIKYGPFSALSS